MDWGEDDEDEDEDEDIDSDVSSPADADVCSVPSLLITSVPSLLITSVLLFPSLSIPISISSCAQEVWAIVSTSRKISSKDTNTRYLKDVIYI